MNPSGLSLRILDPQSHEEFTPNFEEELFWIAIGLHLANLERDLLLVLIRMYSKSRQTITVSPKGASFWNPEETYSDSRFGFTLNHGSLRILRGFYFEYWEGFILNPEINYLHISSGPLKFEREGSTPKFKRESRVTPKRGFTTNSERKLLLISRQIHSKSWEKITLNPERASLRNPPEIYLESRKAIPKNGFLWIPTWIHFESRVVFSPNPVSYTFQILRRSHFLFQEGSTLNPKRGSLQISWKIHSKVWERVTCNSNSAALRILR